ncbi:MAG: methylated-DNA--[protein]-cysteine S-methyltransferase [Firmicutes bacterium]|nr:methylated-DNA--[protein]-cysteine S-methyltransferase [Candidatus Fermentithermobacillaceae bacterium]
MGSYEIGRRYLLNTPIGTVSLIFDGSYLIELSFSDRKLAASQAQSFSDDLRAGSDSGAVRSPGLDIVTLDDAFEKVRREIDLYFEGRLKRFSVPLKLAGPAFFVRVWRALMDIPFGETRTYGQVASLVGAPRAYRAVGNACAANPIAIIVPCHRVVGSAGLGGYGGGLARKEWLLRHEARAARQVPLGLVTG